MRPTQYLESLGVLGENVVMSHCLGLDQSEVETLARTGTKVVAVPTAAVKSGYGMTSEGLLPEMLEAGITVGIGTDAGNNSNLIETNRAMYLIAVLYKDARRSTTAITAETALELATIGGAQALGLGDEIGSIEPGKKADLALYDTRRAEWATLFNPVNSLVYNADGRSVPHGHRRRPRGGGRPRAAVRGRAGADRGGAGRGREHAGTHRIVVPVNVAHRVRGCVANLLSLRG